MTAGLTSACQASLGITCEFPALVGFIYLHYQINIYRNVFIVVSGSLVNPAL
jgi:hypothetical protein